jgi:hypothetical protein
MVILWSFYTGNSFVTDNHSLIRFGLADMENFLDDYLSRLSSSTLPLPQEGVIVFWCVVFVVMHFLASKVNQLVAASKTIRADTSDKALSNPSPQILLLQVLLAAFVFGASPYAGNAFFVFMGGGWAVTTLISLPNILMGFLTYKAYSQPGAMQGSVKMSERLTIMRAAFQTFGMALACLLLGIFLAHLALLGGAFVLTATAVGYLRRLRRLPLLPATEPAALSI